MTKLTARLSFNQWGLQEIWDSVKDHPSFYLAGGLDSIQPLLHFNHLITPLPGGSRADWKRLFEANEVHSTPWLSGLAAGREPTSGSEPTFGMPIIQINRQNPAKSDSNQRLAGFIGRDTLPFRGVIGHEYIRYILCHFAKPLLHLRLQKASRFL